MCISGCCCVKPVGFTQRLHESPQIPDSSHAIIFVTRLMFPRENVNKYARIQSFIQFEPSPRSIDHVFNHHLYTNWRDFFKVSQTVFIYFSPSLSEYGGAGLWAAGTKKLRTSSAFFLFFSAECVKRVNISSVTCQQEHQGNLSLSKESTCTLLPFPSALCTWMLPPLSTLLSFRQWKITAATRTGEMSHLIPFSFATWADPLTVEWRILQPSLLRCPVGTDEWEND